MGVGLHHWANGNFHGATVLLAEGIERLHPFEPACRGVDVSALVREASALRARLVALGADRMGEVDARRALRVRMSGRPRA